MKNGEYTVDFREENKQKPLLETIKTRRAVFPAQYNDAPIPKEAIQRILEAANWAPTHKHTEPWRFKVLREDSLIRFADFMADRYKMTAKKVSERKHRKIRDKLLKSDCVIAICMQRDPKERIPEWEEIAATAMAVQNMWLMASSLKIGAYWSSTSLKGEVGGFFELADGEQCLGFFYMGNFDGPLPESHRKPLESKVVWL